MEDMHIQLMMCIHLHDVWMRVHSQVGPNNVQRLIWGSVSFPHSYWTGEEFTPAHPPWKPLICLICHSQLLWVAWPDAELFSVVMETEIALLGVVQTTFQIHPKFQTSCRWIFSDLFTLKSVTEMVVLSAMESCQHDSYITHTLPLQVQTVGWFSLWVYVDCMSKSLWALEQERECILLYTPISGLLRFRDGGWEHIHHKELGVVIFHLYFHK